MPNILYVLGPGHFTSKEESEKYMSGYNNNVDFLGDGINPIEYLNVNTKYDKVIIQAHGDVNNRSTKEKPNALEQSVIQLNDKPEDTAFVIHALYQYTGAKDFSLLSCHGGSVVNGLSQYNFEEGVTVNSFASSKHTSLVENNKYNAKFICESDESSSQIATRIACHDPQTVNHSRVVQDVNGNTEIVNAKITSPKGKEQISNTLNYMQNNALKFSATAPEDFKDELRMHMQTSSDILKDPDNMQLFKDNAYLMSAFRNKPDRMMNWVENGADSSAITQAGHSPLHIAASKDFVDVAKFAIATGLDPDQKNVEGNSPILLAVVDDKLDLLRILADSGADINIQNNEYHSPLHIAAMTGNVDMMNILLGKGANKELENSKGRTPLYEAVAKGNSDAVDLLIKEDVNVRIDDADGITVLHEAVLSGNPIIVKSLVEAGADLSKQDTDGNTALHYSLITENTTIASILIESIHNVNVPNESNQTPLHLSTQNGDVISTEHLLKKGANVHLRDDNGLTPLHYAARTNNMDMMSVFINAVTRQDEGSIKAETTKNTDTITADVKAQAKEIVSQVSPDIKVTSDPNPAFNINNKELDRQPAMGA